MESMKINMIGMRDKIVGFCRICGKPCTKNDEMIKTRRKTINYFHMDCIVKENRENNERSRNNMAGINS